MKLSIDVAHKMKKKTGANAVLCKKAIDKYQDVDLAIASLKHKWCSGTPDVALGDSKQFWIVYGNETEHEIMIAHYINKPYSDDDYDFDEFPPDWTFTDEDGEYWDAVGWYNRYDHRDFEQFYSAIAQNDDKKVMFWSEIIVPEFFNKDQKL